MPDIFSSALLVPLLAIFTASFMQSITGFGLAIIATPLLIISYEPKLVVIMLQFVSLCSNTLFGLYLRKNANLKLVGYLALGALLGQPIGLYIYGSVSNETLKLLVSIFILVFLFLMQFCNVQIPENNRNSMMTGFLSGLLAMTTGMSGPPLVMYLAYTQQTPAVTRATCVIYFGLINFTALLGFWFSGQPLADAGANALYLLPGLAGGLIFGNLAFQYVSPGLFRRLIFAMLFISCLYTIWTILF